MSRQLAEMLDERLLPGAQDIGITLLQPGEYLLDVGCGWGGLARFAAREFGVKVFGITLEAFRIAGGLILFGISLFYGFFGITCFLDLKFLFLKWLDFSYNYASIAALLFILSGILFKFAAAPFHV